MSIALAQHFQTEILSADSRLFYKGMDIGTAKPSKAEQAGIPHYFIDICTPTEHYNAGDYERDALDVLEAIFLKNDVAIAVGGSGLFLKALTEGLDTFPEVSDATKQKVQELYDTHGLRAYQEQLALLDPVYFSKVDIENPARMRRALEVCMQSGKPYSSFLGQKKTPRPFHVLPILLDVPRATLYARINKRVDTMIADGLEAEVRGLMAMRDYSALRSVGYSEFFDYFDGVYSYEEAIEKIKQHTRNYAKRQATWFRKHGEWNRFESNETAPVLNFLKEQIKNLRKK